MAVYQQTEERRLADIRALMARSERDRKARARVRKVLQRIAREAGVTVAEARAYALAELERETNDPHSTLL